MNEINFYIMQMANLKKLIKPEISNVKLNILYKVTYEPLFKLQVEYILLRLAFLISFQQLIFLLQ